MAWPTLLRRWSARLDADRATTFARFLLRRFVDDRCFESAGALAYTTVFALVPLSAVVFAVLSAFPVFDAWTQRLVDFAFVLFVPAAAQVVAGSLQGLADSARQLPIAGLLVLLASLLLTLLAIERTFDRIWRVRRPRSILWRLTVYWMVLTLGALLAAASLAASAWLFGAERAGGFALVPGLLAFLLFTAAYCLVPNRPVPLRFALAGGLLAALLFEAAKAGFAAYLRNTSFEQIYGALAVVPIFLIWVWLSWAVVLLGASLAASLAAFRYQPPDQRLPPGAELYACLRLLGRLESSRRHGRGLDSEVLRQLEPALTDDLCQQLLEGLAALDIARRGEDGRWSPVRDLATVPLAELHEGLGLRVPPLDPPLPGADDAIGQAALAALRHLRQPLDAALRHPVAEFLRFPTDLPR
ncbi:MAG: YihY family inner membrane protein [Xanthomonadaceae bacterium]|nr:YihY family inner membrane protein [Xanthomonadaceae bacterium]